MTVRYVAVCDGCGEEKGHEVWNAWGRVVIHDPNKVIETQRQYDFCSQDCLTSWWQKVADASTYAPEALP